VLSRSKTAAKFCGAEHIQDQISHEEGKIGRGTCFYLMLAATADPIEQRSMLVRNWIRQVSGAKEFSILLHIASTASSSTRRGKVQRSILLDDGLHFLQPQTGRPGESSKSERKTAMPLSPFEVQLWTH
jgi:hypothetical protein